MRPDLKTRQEEMRQRQEQKEQEKLTPSIHAKCISCRRRQARIGSAFCSRCSARNLQDKLRDTLPGIESGRDVAEQEQNKASQVPSSEPDYKSPSLSDEPLSELTEDETKEPTFTRTEVAKLLGISGTTLQRWERKGKIPSPRRVAHNNQCLYTNELIAAAKEFMSREYVAPVSSSTPGSRFPIAAKKAVKVSRQMERAVASRLGSLGRII